MKVARLILIATGLLMAAGCTPKTTSVTDTQPAPTLQQAGLPTVEPPSAADEDEAPAPTARPARPAPQATPRAAAPKAKAETIYVETEGAQGRVWGHVTMQGDRGTGTIHDWDENTLSVSVSRHGDELFAVDQNSRQYVFKLKNTK